MTSRTTTEPLPGRDPISERALARLGSLLNDKWTLDSLLGVGGMAAVYAATHRNGKRVAVKMLHPELSHNEEVRKRFLQEGYAANTVQHEGAVSVLDDDVAPDGCAFLVMELLEGRTLEEHWQQMGCRLPVPEVLALTDQLLDVLAEAHAKSVVHRDIKPENLFLTRAGALKVLDFGIARVLEVERGRPSSTRVGMVMGTPAFMAPEQARGRWHEVDGRTDLWAVGATMFTLLTGRTVHEAPSEQEQIISSATRRAPHLADRDPTVPATVSAIVDRALSFDQVERWADARSMQDAVRVARGAFGGQPIPPFASEWRRAPENARTRVTSPGGGDPASSGARRTAAATAIDMTPTGSSFTAWDNERELRTAETARLRASIVDLTRRQADAKKRTSDAQAQVDAGRSERSSLEQWFKKQSGTRTAAVDEARQDVRRHTLALARRAVADRATFGEDFQSGRERIAWLELAAASAGRDVLVHQTALGSYDARSLRRGVIVGALLVLALLVAPVVWRATRVVEPPGRPTVP
jgi:serine/threonine protein kinase